MKALHLSQACSVSPRQRLQSLAIVDDDHRVQVARSFVNLIPKKQLQEAPTAPVRRSRSLPSIPVSVVFDAYGHHVPCDVSADRAKEGGGGNGEGDSEDSVVLVCGSFLSFVQNVGSVEHLASGRCKLKRCFWAFNKVGCRKGTWVGGKGACMLPFSRSPLEEFEGKERFQDE
uniref:Uncharacterized protein n=1 Tax=Chromera velia CCMP2878 TaxID=1169474 RepID=A0A0K6S6L0_9ALVE|eukprot:Cvel_16832.t2-p1 / transcript=Cvel_16832.t2 / gene=Cvel_16832 / organism=Chromera_velia_CCMP2878 / gene_product=hypothetical protein / transcript_product=hypothetical protein / location=Cvel_scaffold1315:23300-23815(+) / protein_length=172 / sequence_SO=supercontig / SO=protein_coding / is_pseudo=false